MLLDRIAKNNREIAKNNREIAKIEKEIKRAEKELARRLASAQRKNTRMCSGKKKRDGTPDMRFKANRGCR